MRCFIAIELNPEMQDKIKILANSLAQLNDPALSVVKGYYHVTLAFLGELSIDRVEEIKQGLGEIKAGKFDVELRDVGVFKSKGKIRTIWVGCKGVPRELVQEIDKITGEQRHKPYRAHITIARVKRKPQESLRKWLLDNKNIEIGKQTIEKVVLKRSELQSHGAMYRDVFEKYLN